MKRIFTSIALASLAIVSFAGGLFTNTNQHAAFHRNPALGSSLGIEAVYFNPAGTAFFKEGWSFSGNWQMIWQQRDATNTATDTKYDGKVFVPVMPTLMAAYNTGDWTFSAFFGMPGGGGECEFNDGLPLFDNLISGLGGAFNLPVKGSSEFSSTQYMFSLQLGAAYKITDNFSAYAGIRGNYINNNYNGVIAANADLSAMGMPGNTELLNVSLDLDQTGIAFAPIVGLDYKIGNFNFGAKYEFRAVTNIENETEPININTNATVDGALGGALSAGANMALGSYLGGFADGKTFRNDAPALLSLNGSWQIIPVVKVMAGWNYYFDKDAKVESLLGGDQMKALSRNTIEYQFGTEVNVCKNLLLSAGIQYTNFGMNDSYISDLNFNNDAFMTAIGGKYSINEKLDVNFGYSYTNYAPYNNKGTATYYKRKTHAATIGVDFRL